MNKFDYNDIVYLKDTAGLPDRVNQKAFVVAIIDDREAWPFPDYPTGTIYTIEFEDGAALDAHESWITGSPPEKESAR